jgi:hypothetical protein
MYFIKIPASVKHICSDRNPLQSALVMHALTALQRLV